MKSGGRLFKLILVFSLLCFSEGYACGPWSEVIRGGVFRRQNPVERRKQELKEAFEAVERELNPWESPLCQSSGGCKPQTGRVLEKLAAKGIHLKRILVNNNVPSATGEDGIYHYFLVDDSLGPDKEIIVDSTHTQFFKSSRAAAFFPGLINNRPFIGTRAELEELYEKEAKSSGFSIPGLPPDLSPRAVAQHLYGYGIGEGTRTDATADKTWAKAVDKQNAAQKREYEERVRKALVNKQIDVLQRLCVWVDDGMDRSFSSYQAMSGDTAAKIYAELPPATIEKISSAKTPLSRAQVEELAKKSPALREMLRRYDIVTGPDEAAAIHEMRRLFASRAPHWENPDTKEKFETQKEWVLRDPGFYLHPHHSPLSPVAERYFRRVRLAFENLTFEQFQREYLPPR